MAICLPTVVSRRTPARSGVLGCSQTASRYTHSNIETHLMTQVQAPQTMQVRARIHPRALDHMPLFFDATAPTVFAELIQNARRAGASHVDITTKSADSSVGEEALKVTVQDNGHGIADPSVLLSFGQSAWDKDLARQERVAGMGFACLARRGCSISSRAQAPRSRYTTGWRMSLEPDHFLGKTAATVASDNTAPSPFGTRVTFHATDSLNALCGAVVAASRYAPLRVSFNGTELARREFPETALHREEWNGVALGVIKSRHPFYREPDLNFHGVTLNVRLPHVKSLDGEIWTVRADVVDCRELELVLPARKEAVENAFLQELRHEARLAIYRALEPTDPPPRFVYEDHIRAANAGIDLPPPPVALRSWRPRTADVHEWRGDTELENLGPDSIIVEYDADPPDTQTFYRTARRAKLAPNLFEADRRLAGYAWYDKLPRLTDVNTHIEIDGVAYTERELRRQFSAARYGDGAFDPRDRATRIVTTVSVAQPDGTQDANQYMADIALLDKESDLLSDPPPVITAGSDISADELALLLRRAYFCPSDDSEADSYESQSTQFDDAALHVALKHVASAEEAIRTAIAQVVRREIQPLIPRDRHADITISGDRIDITLGGPLKAETGVRFP